jgi:hypothetical protein
MLRAAQLGASACPAASRPQVRFECWPACGPLVKKSLTSVPRKPGHGHKRQLTTISRAKAQIRNLGQRCKRILQRDPTPGMTTRQLVKVRR